MKILLQSELKSSVNFQEQSPCVIYSSNDIYHRATSLNAIANASNVEMLVALKAAPDDEVLDSVFPVVAGVDVSNVGEINRLKNLPGNRIVSLTGPSWTHGIHSAKLNSGWEIFSNSESAHQLHTAIQSSALGANIGVRLVAMDYYSAPATEPPFGFDETTLRNLLRTNEDLRYLINGVHVHGGSRENTPEKVKLRVVACLATARRLGLNLKYINCGGGFGKFSFADFRATLVALRKLAPTLRIIVEPGEFLFESCGWAEATVIDVGPTARGAKAVVDISSPAHLRWSLNSTLAKCEPNQDRIAVDFVGPTCFRGDFLGSRWLRPSIERPFGIQIGDRIRIEEITSYGGSWNLSFNGVPAAFHRYL